MWNTRDENIHSERDLPFFSNVIDSDSKFHCYNWDSNTSLRTSIKTGKLIPRWAEVRDTVEPRANLA